MNNIRETDSDKEIKKENDIEKTLQDRQMAEIRHDFDSGIFQGRYVNFKMGRFK